MDEKCREWTQISGFICANMRPIKVIDQSSENPVLEKINRFVNSKLFRRCTNMFIFISILVLCFQSFGQSSAYSTFYNSISLMCSCFFVISTTCKIVGLRLFYFHCKYNILELLIVSTCDLLLVISFISGSNVSFVPESVVRLVLS